MKTSRILFLIALTLTLGMQAEAKKVKLEYKLKTGDKFAIERTVNQDITQEVMGNPQTTQATTVFTYEFNVTGVANNEIQMDVALVGFAISSVNPMGEVKYNSATDTVVPDFARISVAGMNQAYKVSISPLGVISSCKVPDGLTDKVAKLAESLTGGQMQMAANAAVEAAGEAGFRKTLSEFMIIFPEGGAQAKEPWEVEAKVQQMTSFLAKVKYELAESTKEFNTINVKAVITQDPAMPPMEMQGMTITYEMLGANEGTMKLDANTGLVTTSEVITSMTGTVALDSPQLPSPMTIPVTVRSTDTMKRK